MVLEVANQFSFFGIDTDNGKPLTLKAGTQRRDVSELLVAVRASFNTVHLTILIRLAGSMRRVRRGFRGRKG
jgi:hypothetical protein